MKQDLNLIRAQECCLSNESKALLDLINSLDTLRMIVLSQAGNKI